MAHFEAGKNDIGPENYNIPQILDRGIRCMLAFQELKEGGYGKEHATQS
jgi:hypothetical protein